MKLLVFGSMNIDHVYGVAHLLRAGETLSSAAYVKNAGGKGFNQALALSKAGAQVHFAGAIGADGLFMRDMLEALSVDTQALAVTDTPTGHAIIQVDAQGQNCILLYGGANQRITEDGIDETLAAFGSGDWLLIQNEISCGEALLKKAHARGMTVALNPSPISQDLLSWPLELCDWLILNEVEGRDLTGESAPDAILDALLERYPRTKIVLTLGEDGSVYADAALRVRQSCIRAKTVDTTAAGDTFTGYFLEAMMCGEDVAAALRIASHASAIAVSRPGAGASVPEAEEVRRQMINE